MLVHYLYAYISLLSDPQHKLIFSLWKSLCPCCSLWPWLSRSSWWCLSRSHCPRWWNRGSRMRLVVRANRAWTRPLWGWQQGQKNTPSPRVSGVLRGVSASCAEEQTSHNYSCAPPDHFSSRLGWMRSTILHPLCVSVRCRIWGLSWSPPGTSWSAGRGCGLTSLRDDASVVTFWTNRETPAPPVACSVWRTALLSCRRHLRHNAIAASVCALSFWGSVRIVEPSEQLVESTWASSQAPVVGRGHFPLCWPRSGERLWAPRCVNPPGPSVLWQAPGRDRWPGSSWVDLLWNHTSFLWL